MADAGDEDWLISGFGIAGEPGAPDSPESDPRIIAERLVNECERFAHLKEGDARLVFVFRGFTKAKAGKDILGSIHIPRFQGELASLASWLLDTVLRGANPDFLVILDWKFWYDATPLQREALVFHELCHTAHAHDREGELRYDSNGRPVFEMQGHDLEEFRDVVARYGAWLDDIAHFADALASGGVLGVRETAA